MRVDQYLNKVCLIKTRSMAKKACDLNLVKINGKIAKASSIVTAEDEIEYSLSGYKNLIKVKVVPAGNVSKATAPQYYEFLERNKIDLEF
ncbi:MAG TPA: S4 domain-containing protein [Candidatus Cloacimonadota bacterium]|nr:S4 domain-containing protein [Candidatus Cloacimonadota bacterium]